MLGFILVIEEYLNDEGNFFKSLSLKKTIHMKETFQALSC